MKQYIVIKTYADGTFSTEFFKSEIAARNYVDAMRKVTSGIIVSVGLYELVDY